ncbi:MAG: malto-oligosyltrehalose trehalohydrolase [Spirochaetaceae bacterium]|nr:malto-oligosyltrehalose trehalohydrolase [Spirochaetaceae bacterium]
MTVWAPLPRSVTVVVDGASFAMERSDDGWWSAHVPAAAHGSDYAFVLDDGPPLPDPRSRWQPRGVHGPSRVYDHGGFAWTDGSWRGTAVPGAVFYELHIGTFTEGGTLDAAIERLDHLVSLGVDVVGLMPVAAFAGDAGWGYDGAHPYAVHEPYGGPDALKRLVDACHARGLAVCLDVVYNHLGPSGNYLPQFGPYFTEKHQTPWGAAVNLDDEGSTEVRRWVIDNALTWMRDFHVDALRLDAVHALEDDSPVHVLAELSREVDALSVAVRRPLSLVAESDLNQPTTVLPVDGGGLGMTAQWSDDFHHALHALLTGEGQGYYADFAEAPFEALTRTLTGAFFHDGRHSSFRGAPWGAPVDRSRVPGWRFLGYLQTHDQVGNRALGDRIGHGLPAGLARVGAALVLTSPFTPMLFMGEEWGASTPWQYFTSHEEEALAEAVRAGRRREFAAHGWAAEDVPDPQDGATVAASTLRWEERSEERHASMLGWYRALISLRRSEPELSDPRLDRVAVVCDARARWVVVTRGSLRIVANLAAAAQPVPLEGEAYEVLLASQPPTRAAGGLTLPAEAVVIARVTPRP